MIVLLAIVAWVARFRAATDVDGVIRTELVEAEDTTVHATSGAVNGVIDVGAALILASIVSAISPASASPAV